jgi:hypothetical protein
VFRSVAVPLLATLAAAGLAGCAPSGGGGVDTGEFSGEEKRVAEVLDELADAGRRSDGERVCSDLLARRVVDQLGRRCADALEEQLDHADVFELDVDDITVSGTRATARVRSDFNGTEQPRTLVLVREGQDWKLAGLSGR